MRFRNGGFLLQTEKFHASIVPEVRGYPEVLG